MAGKELKKFLAGLGIASLVAGTGVPGSTVGASGWSASKTGAVGTEEVKKKPAPSGWSGKKESAVSTEMKKEQPADSEDEKAGEEESGEEESEESEKDSSEESKPESSKSSGKSGWSGSKK